MDFKSLCIVSSEFRDIVFHSIRPDCEGKGTVLELAIDDVVCGNVA